MSNSSLCGPRGQPHLDLNTFKNKPQTVLFRESTNKYILPYLAQTMKPPSRDSPAAQQVSAKTGRTVFQESTMDDAVATAWPYSR